MRFRLTAAALFAVSGVLACAKGGGSDTAKDSTKTAATGGSGAPVTHSDSVFRIAMIDKI